MYPGDQAAVWIHPNPLPRDDEECSPGEHADGLDQFVPAAQAAVEDLNDLSEKSAQNTLAASDETEIREIRRQNATGK